MREPHRPKTGRSTLFYLMLMLGLTGVLGFVIVAIAAGHRGGG